MSHSKPNYIVVKDRRPRISEVINDCNAFCISASSGDSLTVILTKMCNKITLLESKLAQLTTIVAGLTARIEILEE